MARPLKENKLDNLPEELRKMQEKEQEEIDSAITKEPEQFIEYLEDYLFMTEIVAQAYDISTELPPQMAVNYLTIVKLRKALNLSIMWLENKFELNKEEIHSEFESLDENTQL